jgi:hypothetical protein
MKFGGQILPSFSGNDRFFKTLLRVLCALSLVLSLTACLGTATDTNNTVDDNAGLCSSSQSQVAFDSENYKDGILTTFVLIEGEPNSLSSSQLSLSSQGAFSSQAQSSAQVSSSSQALSSHISSSSLPQEIQDNLVTVDGKAHYHWSKCLMATATYPMHQAKIEIVNVKQNVIQTLADSKGCFSVHIPVDAFPVDIQILWRSPDEWTWISNNPNVPLEQMQSPLTTFIRQP